VVVHPFADGNGRVARELASVYLYRAYSVPLLVLVESKEIYLRTLELADEGRPQAFVGFIQEQVLDELELAADELRRPRTSETRAKVDELAALLSTLGGLTHADVDAATARLLRTAATITEQCRPRQRFHRRLTVMSGFGVRMARWSLRTRRICRSSSGPLGPQSQRSAATCLSGWAVRTTVGHSCCMWPTTWTLDLGCG